MLGVLAFRCGARLAIVSAALTSGCGSPAYEVVSASPAGAFETSLTTFADGMAVAWYDTRDGHPEIYQRALDAEGKPIGSEQRLTFGQAAAYEVDVQSLSRAIAVGWYEKGADGHLVPWLGVWNRDGAPLWTKAIASSGRNTVVRATRGAIFAAWIEDEPNEHAGVWGAWWRENGTELIAPRRLADAGKTTWNLNAAVDPASTPGRLRAWVAFDAVAGTKREELFLVDAGETPGRVVRLTSDDDAASKYPDVAFTEDRAAVTWFDTKDGNEEVYLFVGTLEQLQQGGNLPGRRVTRTSGHSIGAYLAWIWPRLV